MFRHTWTLFTCAGLPIRADLSVGLLVVIVALGQDSLLMGLVLAASLLVGILLHELAHCAVAITFGGQVREVRLQMLGGAAMISRMPPKAWQEALMAIAGPLCSLLLALSGFCAANLLRQAEYDPFWEVYYSEPNIWCLAFCGVNLGLACFNLIPAFPMDGGRVLRATLEVCGLRKVRATEIAVRVGQGIAVMWIVLWVAAWIFKWHLACPAALGVFGRLMWALLFGAHSPVLPLIACMIWIVGRRELQLVRATTWTGDWR